ncbi:MAG: hypothetical protein JNK45_29225 [Myxococcales bacterium]|nr:hypothetical protein [Myxococcales bacterium]
MSRPEICPTCGIKLGPTQPRPATRVCTACSRSNPAGFNYCGFCATPMENTEMGARMADLAAPPGGWPSLTSELVEVRFYLQQGLFDDAYELLSIMQKRYPGHPQLNELSRRPKPARRVDTGVLALVDSVLAESANLVAKVPRRAAPRFTAPAQGGSDRTDVHSVVPPDDEATTTAARPPKRAKTGPESTTRRSGAQPKVGTGSQRTTPQKPSGPSGSHRTSVGPRPTAAAAPKPAAPAAREPTRIYRTVEPPPGARPVIVPSTAPSTPSRQASGPRPVVAQTGAPPVRSVQAPAVRPPAVTGQTVAQRPPQSGHTVVVDALQSPAPFPAEPAEAAPRGKRRRAESAAKPAPAPAAAPVVEAPPAATAEKPEPRRRATFGEHVLNRLR